MDILKKLSVKGILDRQNVLYLHNFSRAKLGVTGSGKTFTMANIIQWLNKPTLEIAHNKTLAGQLYSEFKEFFLESAVDFFVLLLLQLIVHEI